jgi:hypothetical protein
LLLLALAVPVFAAAEAPAAGPETNVRRELDQLGDRIDSLDQRARAAGEDSRESLMKQVEKLRQKKDQAEALLRKLEGEAEEAGRDTRARLNRAIGSLRRACRDLGRKLEGKSAKAAAPRRT